MSTSQPPSEPPRRLSALPSQLARFLAFSSIVIGGLAGGVIGYGVVKVQCQGTCTTQKSIGAIVGALFIGIGIAVVAVLVLRAMGEWNAVKEREARVQLGSRVSLTPQSSASSASDDGVPRGLTEPNPQTSPGTGQTEQTEQTEQT